MRIRSRSALVGSLLLACAVSASAQINYVARDSFVGYFEQDFDPNAVPPFQEPITFEASDAAGTTTGEAFDALLSLGYKPNEVNKLIGQLDTDNQSAEDIIRQALKQVAK